jgi:hypothetical protein
LAEGVTKLNTHPERGTWRGEISRTLASTQFGREQAPEVYVTAVRNMNFSDLQACLQSPERGNWAASWAGSVAFATTILRRPVDLLNSGDATFVVFLESSICGVYRDLVNPDALSVTAVSSDDVSKLVIFLAEGKVYPTNPLDAVLFTLLDRISRFFDRENAERSVSLLLETIDKLGDTKLKRRCQIRVAEFLVYGTSNGVLFPRIETYMKSVSDPLVRLALLRLR